MEVSITHCERPLAGYFLTTKSELRAHPDTKIKNLYDRSRYMIENKGRMDKVTGIMRTFWTFKTTMERHFGPTQ